MKRTFAFFLATLLSLTMVFPAMAMGSIDADDNATLIIDEPYQYPVNFWDTEQLMQMEKEERLANFNIPDSILSKMSTSALIETLLNNPLCFNYLGFEYGHWMSWVELNKNENNVFCEILNRDDLTESLFDVYRKLEVIDTSIVYTLDSESVEYKKFLVDFSKPNNAESLFIADQLVNGEYNDSEKLTLSILLSQKTLEKSNYPDYSYSTYEKYTSMTGDFDCFFRSESTEIQNSTTPGSIWDAGLVYTPMGRDVPTQYNKRPEFSSLEITLTNASVASKYPNALRLANPTVKYNCHSYAWYWPATGNLHWMENPAAYMMDSCYIRTTNPSVGDIAYWAGAEHSGIITEISGGTIWVISKWGEQGLYKHILNDCDYTNSISYWTPNF